MEALPVLGVDVGGTGIKAALVDVLTGTLLTEKLKILTPRPATPDAIADTVVEMMSRFDYQGPVGCGFPSVIKNDLALTATNLDQAWLSTNVAELFSSRSGLPFYVLNDADAAGIAEANFGAAKGVEGLVITITIGTGVGSGMLLDAQLIENSELGFVPVKGGIAETRISNRARIKGHLGWMVWGRRLNDYLKLLETLFHPKMIVLGGGVSKKFETFSKYIQIETPVIPAHTQNNAGCIGAAWWAARKTGKI
jgi:polyphosphate glucokinase